MSEQCLLRTVCLSGCVLSDVGAHQQAWHVGEYLDGVKVPVSGHHRLGHTPADGKQVGKALRGGLRVGADGDGVRTRCHRRGRRSRQLAGRAHIRPAPHLHAMAHVTMISEKNNQPGVLLVINAQWASCLLEMTRDGGAR